MMNKVLALVLLTLWMCTATYAQQSSDYFRYETKEFGETKIETRVVNSSNRASGEAIISHGKRDYIVKYESGNSLKLFSVRGDIKLPKKRDPIAEKLDYAGSFMKKRYGNKRLGLKAHFIQYIPDYGLVGINISNKEKERFKEGQPDIILGEIKWHLDLSSGEVKPISNEEIIMHQPYQRVFAKRLIYLNNKDLVSDKSHGYFFEDSKPVKKWNNLSVMVMNGYIQLAENKMGEAYEVMVLDSQLQVRNTYFPALLVYRNYDKMPKYKTFRSRQDLISDYRNGKGLGAPSLFRKQVLIPSDEIEGLYGVLQEDGSVEIPEGSLGLSPILTEEKGYLLNHFFLVAYPGEKDGSMVYAVANSQGKLSFGSAKQPVWTEWMIFESEIIKENNGSISVHPELLVARLPNGNWQCYLASRYSRNAFSRYENLNFYFPTPIGRSTKTQHEAIGEVEEILVGMNASLEKINAKRMAEYKARIKLESEKRLAAKNRRMDEWAKANPTPKPSQGGGRFFNSSWQGFTYSSQTTSRYNQTVNRSNYNNSMRQYNNYLNSKIYRKY